MFIYLDESGDLGFDFKKPATTKHFVIALLVCNSRSVQKAFKKAVKRTLRNKVNQRRNKSRQVKELKGTSTTLEIKKYFFGQLKNDDWLIYALVLNKQRVQQHLRTRDGKKKLYNYLARFLLEKLPLSSTSANVRLVVDRCKNRKEVKDFNQYVQTEVEARLPLNTRLIIEHLSSQENGGLQAADMFCWGIARKHRYSDVKWYDVYRHKIEFETVYLL